MIHNHFKMFKCLVAAAIIYKRNFITFTFYNFNSFYNMGHEVVRSNEIDIFCAFIYQINNDFYELTARWLLIDSKDPDEIAQILEGLPDFTSFAYRYGVASSLLQRSFKS